MGQTLTQQWIQNWLDYLAAQGRSKHTLSAYRRAINHLVKWNQTTYGESFHSDQLIARDVRDWKSYQQTVEQAAPSTINQRLVGVASFYQWAVANQIVEQNPIATIKSIQLPPRQPQSLSYQDLRRLLRAVHNGGSLRDIAMIEMLAGTGVNFRIICPCFWNYLSRTSELFVLDFVTMCPGVLTVFVHTKIMLPIIYTLTDDYQFLLPLKIFVFRNLTEA